MHVPSMYLLILNIIARSLSLEGKSWTLQVCVPVHAKGSNLVANSLRITAITFRHILRKLACNNLLTKVQASNIVLREVDSSDSASIRKSIINREDFTLAQEPSS